MFGPKKNAKSTVDHHHPPQTLTVPGFIYEVESQFIILALGPGWVTTTVRVVLLLDLFYTARIISLGNIQHAPAPSWEGTPQPVKDLSRQTFLHTKLLPNLCPL